MYTEIENHTYNKGTDDEETVINWRMRRGYVQLRCPKCDNFFVIPKGMTFNDEGYASDSLYHFCDDIYLDEENHDGWQVLPHLVGWNG